MVYWVAGSRFFWGAKERTVPELESTKGCKATGVPADAVPFNNTRLPWEIDCGLIGAVVVTVITVLAGTPRAPSAGETTALVTVPERVMSRGVVWPAVTCTDAVPRRLVCGTPAFTLADPESAGRM